MASLSSASLSHELGARDTTGVSARSRSTSVSTTWPSTTTFARAEPADAGALGELGELGDEALYKEAATDLMVASSSSPEDSAQEE
jgi:hypothetical protein